ncbi:MAG: redoxin family protein [Balneola sp.]|jgi:peroxiredoxin
MKLSTITFFFLLIFTLNCAETPSSEVIDEDPGKDAPNFTLTSLDGNQVSLSGLKGKVVYIFFFGANCPHCRDNGPVTENTIYAEFKDDQNFVALGLDTWNTSAGAVQNFKEATGITYTLLLNARQSLVDYYGNASSYDRSVVISAEGKIAYQGTQFVNQDADKVVDVIQEELEGL